MHVRAVRVYVCECRPRPGRVVSQPLTFFQNISPDRGNQNPKPWHARGGMTAPCVHLKWYKRRHDKSGTMCGMARALPLWRPSRAQADALWKLAEAPRNAGHRSPAIPQRGRPAGRGSTSILLADGRRSGRSGHRCPTTRLRHRPGDGFERLQEKIVREIL